MVAASGTLVLVLAAGVTLGPTLGGFAIELYGPAGVFYLLSLTAGLTVMTALFRLWSGRPRMESHNRVVAMAANLTPQATNLFSKASSPGDDPE